MSQVLDLFSKKLAALLAERRMSQNALAETSGVSQGSITRYIRGLAAPGIDQLEALAKALQTTPWQLICPDEELGNSVGKDQHLQAMAEMSVKLAMSQGQVDGLRVALLEKTRAAQQMKSDSFTERLDKLPAEVQKEAWTTLDEILKGYEAEHSSGKEPGTAESS